ncbi:MAG: sugar transferase [Gammaproteobacteria bacterium]|nr:sugar transferase [Gammaproteobacteria bacterium]
MKARNSIESMNGLDLRDAIQLPDGRYSIRNTFSSEDVYVRDNRKLKHALDRMLAALLLVLLSPVLLICAGGIALEALVSPRSRGPILYKQTRISAGRPFELLKFHTFYLEDDAALAHLKDTTWFINERPQTVWGRVVRKFYLDELPQLFNILKGEMSFVGPRPWPRKQFLEAVERGYHAMRLIKGGVCGPVQATKGVGHCFRTTLEMDEVLVRNYLSRSALGVVAVDLAVVWATLKTVMRAQGL